MGLSQDLAVAAALVAATPGRLGGIWIKGEVDRDALIAALGPGLRILPCSIDEERLVGGLDIAATLAAGRPVHRAGILGDDGAKIFVIPGAERLTPAMAGRIAAAMDEGRIGVVLLDQGGPDEQPPACLTERVAFHLSFVVDGADGDGSTAIPEDELVRTVAGVAAALGVASPRADLFALAAARGHSLLRGIPVDECALAFAARTVLAPRATRLPEEAAPPPDQEESAQPQSRSSETLEDVVLEAVRTALPPELLASLSGKDPRRQHSPSQGAGARIRSQLRGRPAGTRRGKPGSGARLAILDTLRAAAPWQAVRGRTDRIRIARDDLRVRRYQDRAASLTIFAVDASGSAAAQRLAEAKGAVETLLAQSYVRRAEVALIAVRGSGATLLLPPTRSLTRARRLLAELPGGGGTPLAAGIDAARLVAEAAPARGRTPSIVLLTDGRANVALDGSHGRENALADAAAAARRIALTGVRALVIDIGPRARPEASSLAQGMAARYLHLPLADGATLGRAVADAAA